MIVFKFGGKSLASKEKISKIAKYIKSRCKKEKLIVVVSAMADTTDRLIETAKSYSKNPCERELDAFVSCGENLSASLLSIKLCSLGVRACSLLGWQAKIFASGNFGHGTITSVDKSYIESRLAEYDCVVVAGFQAENENGNIITLGRGGSDTTAVALGAVFGCPVEIYSDFDGIFAGDPRRENYKKYKQVDFETALRYAQTGAKVLSEQSAQIAKDAQTQVVCKSSSKPHLCGTKLTSIPTPFVGINVKENLCEVEIVFNENLQKIAKTVQFLLKKVNFQHLTIKAQTITLVIKQDDLKFVENEIAKINQLF